MYIIYNQSGQMIGQGYDNEPKACKAASDASRRDTLDIYSIYKDFILDRQYKAGQIYKKTKAMGVGA